jgi:hypothetical protein
LKALQAIYPDYVQTTKTTKPQTTKQLPRGYWQDKENQKKFFDQLAIKWNIQKPEDWNKMTCDMVVKEGGSFIYKYYNGSLNQGNNVPFSNVYICER